MSWFCCSRKGVFPEHSKDVFVQVQPEVLSDASTATAANTTSNTVQTVVKPLLFQLSQLQKHILTIFKFTNTKDSDLDLIPPNGYVKFQSDIIEIVEKECKGIKDEADFEERLSLSVRKLDKNERESFFALYVNFLGNFGFKQDGSLEVTATRCDFNSGIPLRFSELIKIIREIMETHLSQKKILMEEGCKFSQGASYFFLARLYPDNQLRVIKVANQAFQSGSYGKVHEAVSLNTGEKRVFKVARFSDPARRERCRQKMMRELKILEYIARYNFSGFQGRPDLSVQFQESGTNNDRWIFMGYDAKYVPHTLLHWCIDSRRTYEQRIKVAANLANIILKLNICKLWHGDISNKNVLVNDQDECILIDWATCQVLEYGQKPLIGGSRTCAYIHPKDDEALYQADALAQTQLQINHFHYLAFMTDQFALSVLIYEALFAKSPYPLCEQEHYEHPCINPSVELTQWVMRQRGYSNDIVNFVCSMLGHNWFFRPKAVAIADFWNKQFAAVVAGTDKKVLIK